MHNRAEGPSFRALFMFLVPAFVACGPQNGARPLKVVRQDNAAIRSRIQQDLERSVIFPRCESRPSAAHTCGLLASRAAEHDIVGACGEPICVNQKVEALYAAVQQRAEALGIDVRAIDLRCGPPCRDLRALELEVLRLSAEGAEQRARQAYLRADNAEREALEREHEDLPPFEKRKKERDTALDALIERQRRDLQLAAREDAAAAHTSLCARSDECTPEHECRLFRGAGVGTCEAP